MLPGSATGAGAVVGGVLPRAESRRSDDEWLQAGSNPSRHATATAVRRRRLRALDSGMTQACPIRRPEVATDGQETSTPARPKERVRGVLSFLTPCRGFCPVQELRGLPRRLPARQRSTDHGEIERAMMKKRLGLLLRGSVALAVTGAGPAWAHAEFQNATVPADSHQELVLNVPVERPAAENARIEITLPDSFDVHS